ncbi:hypothetical protein [Rahnella sp. ChDrAdgB13]|uniref:hypothetical protein n=1 Tax=Rahnella sp. ChDrAdgB13 TaxID=1850581 RepID=UPI001AD891F6|nr:hypothetical protein [Rahnella sp. ChDrAdgB13]
MAKNNQAPVAFDMLDIGDELYVIDAMLTTVNNFNNFERAEYKVTHGGMLMIIAARITQLKNSVDKFNNSKTE